MILSRYTSFKKHENDIRVVTKEKEWRMVDIPEFGDSDKTLMDYIKHIVR